tara:strand:+ start:290 stop:790 length:501 start_codon:yes stop_codon:yes gene_type:complete
MKINKLPLLLSILSLCYVLLYFSFLHEKQSNKEELKLSLSHLVKTLEDKEILSNQWMLEDDLLNTDLDELVNVNISSSSKAVLSDFEKQLGSTIQEVKDKNQSLIDQLKSEIAYLKNEVKKLQKHLNNQYNKGTDWTVYVALIISLIGHVPSFWGMRKIPKPIKQD